MPRNEPYPEEMIPIADIPEALLVGAGMHPDYPRGGQPEGRISRGDLENFGAGELGGTFQTRAHVARQNDDEAAYVGVARDYMNITGRDSVDMPINWGDIGDRALSGDPTSLNIIRRATQLPLVTYYEDLEYRKEIELQESLRRRTTQLGQDQQNWFRRGPDVGPVETGVEAYGTLGLTPQAAPSVPQNKSARLIMAYLSNGIPVPQKVQNEYPDLYRELLDVPPRDMKRMLRMKPDTDGKMEKIFKSKLDHGVGITENEKLTYPTAYESAYSSHHGHQPQDFLDMDTSGDNFINSVLDQVNEKYTTPALKDDTFKTLSDDEKLIRAYAKNDMPVPESLLEDNNEYYQRTLQELQDSGEIQTDEMRKDAADLRKERWAKNKKRQQELKEANLKERQKKRDKLNERRKDRGLPTLPPITPPKSLIPPTPPTPSQPTTTPPKTTTGLTPTPGYLPPGSSNLVNPPPTPTSIGGPNRPGYNLPSTNIGSRIIPPQFSEFEKGRFSGLGPAFQTDGSRGGTGKVADESPEDTARIIREQEEASRIQKEQDKKPSLRPIPEQLYDDAKEGRAFGEGTRHNQDVPPGSIQSGRNSTTPMPVQSRHIPDTQNEFLARARNPQSDAAQQLGENVALNRSADNDSQSQQQRPIIVNAPVTNNNNGGSKGGGVDFASTSISKMNDGFMTLPRWRRQYG